MTIRNSLTFARLLRASSVACGLVAAMLIASEATAETGISWAKAGGGLAGYDAVPGKRICRTASQKDGSLILGAAYNGTCHYYHYAEALKSRKFEYLLPPKGGAIKWAYPGPTLTSSGLTPIKTGDWNWACSPDSKNVGYVWRDKSGKNKCYFFNGSNGAAEGSESYRILAFGTAASHASYEQSTAARYAYPHDTRVDTRVSVRGVEIGSESYSDIFGRKNGQFSCKSPVTRQADGCSVPRNFGDADFDVPDEIPGFLVDIAEAGMDGLFNDNDYNKFRGACNEHDICYRSPWFLGKGGRVDCEKEFERDLQRRCDFVHDDGSPNWAVCKITAAAMAAAVKDHGQSRFNDGQNWSKDNCVYPYVQ